MWFGFYTIQIMGNNKGELTMKHCVDCEYCEEKPSEFTGVSFFVCKHPKSLKHEDPVTGEKSFSHCHIMRTSKCGKEGNLFVEKEKEKEKKKKGIMDLFKRGN